jgi:peptidoglycan/LPS O-acetylase OafA/YrhL
MPTIKKDIHLSNNKIAELESIRGLAALLIIFVHTPHWNPNFESRIVHNAYLMVELFFVLSGFVIYTSYSSKINTYKDLFRFQFLRFSRLYPVHLLFLIIFLLIEFAKYYVQNNTGIIGINKPAFQENNLTALFQQIFLLQAIGPTGNILTFDYPAWSISVEFYTYLIFGVIILFTHKFKQLVLLIVFIISLLLLINKATFGFESLLRCISGFSLGCLCAYIISKFPTVVLPSFLSFFTFISIILFLEFKTESQSDVVIYFLTAALILTIVLSNNGFIKKVFKCKVLTWLGSISYSIYMSHALVVHIVDKFIIAILKKPVILIENIRTSQLSVPETFFAYTVIIFTVLVISQIVYKYVEQPFRTKSRQFASTLS